LGPLEVLAYSRTVDMRGRKQPALLIHANDVVSPDALIDDMWHAGLERYDYRHR
jgi:hypothetical protein